MKKAHDAGPRAGAAGGEGTATGAAGSSIVLNGESRTVAPGVSVAELLDGLGLEPGMVVVERNRAILARRDLAGTPVEDGDRFELVHFVGGG